MVTNYEVDAFISSLRDEEAEVQGLIKNFLKVLDDAHNPELASARRRLRELMQRDAEIGKHQQVWPLLAPWLIETSAPAKPGKPKGTVIKDIGVAPP
jgi:hypothetical protein